MAATDVRLIWHGDGTQNGEDMARRRRAKRYFGSVRRLPSGRWQARYTGPDRRVHTARTGDGRSLTFDTKGDAEAWLALRHSEILRGAWLPPSEATTSVTLRRYAEGWVAARDLAATTKDHYRQLLRDHVYPTFGDVPVREITPAAVRDWYARLGRSTGPTARAHTYGLLRTIMNTAVADKVIAANPCRVRGGGQSRRAKTIRPATLPELAAIVDATPSRYRLMVLLAAWCALRFGELAALTREDIDVDQGVIRVRRGVVRTSGGPVVKAPKSVAGRRDVAVPPHLMPVVTEHLDRYVAAGPGALVFPAAGDPARHLAPSSAYRWWYAARDAAGRPDLRFHDLRHTGAVLAAATGATLAELMARLGHSTAGAALRYQHAARERDREIAAALSGLAVTTTGKEQHSTG